jgi:hypothetical protein
MNPIRSLALTVAVLLGSSVHPVMAAVTIHETFDPSMGTGSFEVVVGTDEPVLDVGWFAVRNDAATDASTDRFGWTSELISAQQWVDGYDFYIFGVLNTANYPWPELTDDPGGSAVFYYAIYLGGGVGGSPIAPGQSDAGFHFSTAAPGSPWIAGNDAGDRVQYGDTGVVPVPPAAALLAVPAWLAARRRT